MALDLDLRTVEAAKAICRTYFGSVREHGDARCCQLGGKDGCCLESIIPVAVAAIRAADKVTVKD